MGKKRERDIYAYLGPSSGFRAVVVATHQSSDDMKRILSLSDKTAAHYFKSVMSAFMCVCVCVMHSFL